MRRGFWKELDTVFQGAAELVGGTYPPEEMGARIEEIKAFHKEVKLALKMWETQVKATARALGSEVKKPARARGKR